MNGLGVFLILAGAALIAASRLAARVTDPINERVTGRPFNDRRAYVLVGVGLIILGVAVLAGLA
jgi:uncharacterized membrane protein YidH (DUF202 family)